MRSLPLQDKIAALARSWAVTGAQPGENTWNGLLIVTAEQCRRLERALFEATVPFGRLRYISEGEFVYEEPKPSSAEPEFEYRQTIRVSESARGATPEIAPFKPKPVLLLKVLGCELFDDAPAMSTDQLLRSVWERISLPDVLARHMANAAFLMLGGGVLQPDRVILLLDILPAIFRGLAWCGRARQPGRATLRGVATLGRRRRPYPEP